MTIGRWLSAALTVAALSSCGAEPGVDAEAIFQAFPQPPPRSTPSTAATDFVGAEACAPCHERQYQAWSASTHGRAGGEPGPAVVIAPFDGHPIRFADATVTPRVRSGAYEFMVRRDGLEDTIYRVDGVIGGAHMLGGGTQGFVSRHADGTERFLPWDWSGSESVWFCNTNSRAELGWQRITPDMRLAECGDWPPLRPLGAIDRFANCQECHGSQIHIALDRGSGYRTEYTSLGVNCESCHGPGARHVELMSSDSVGPGAEIAMESLAYVDKDASLGVCFRCHALKDVVEEGYLPGERFEVYYALKYPVLGDRPYFYDGRVRSFAYQGNHLASACYLQGPMDCVSCHEPHGQGYWDIDHEPLASPFDDGQCTACHPSKAVAVESHTYHPAGSEGSRCVSCHMPYLQHPEVGDDIPFARSDHTIAVPRPVFDADLGIDGACMQCHPERSSLELETQARAWWGEPKPHRPLVSGLVGEFRARNLSEAAALLLRPDEADPLIQFQALARIVSGYLAPDVDSLPAEVQRRLEELTSSPDVDVRSLALAALHWSRGDDPAVRSRLVRTLEEVTGVEGLRARWVLALGFLGDLARDRGDYERGRAAYRKALEISPDDPRVLHSLGQMYNREGSYELAADAMRRSLASEPLQPLAWVNLGIALAGAGDVSGARAAYEEALRINPHESLAHFNLGNTYQRADRLEEAAAAYARAVAADPGLGLAHFELGRIYIRLERFEEALRHARHAVEFMPDHAASRQMLADLEATLEGA